MSNALSIRYNAESDYIQLNNMGEWVNWKLAGLNFNGVLYNTGTFSRYWGNNYLKYGKNSITAVNGSYINIALSWNGEDTAKNLTIFQTPVDTTNYCTLRITVYSSYVGSWELYKIGYALKPTDESFTGASKAIATTSQTIITFDISNVDELYIAGYLYSYSANNYGAQSRYLRITKIELL